MVLWPAVQVATADTGPRGPKTISFFGGKYTPDPEVTLLLLVAVLSALGSYVHAAQSFVDFAGNRRLVVSWVWWYPFRIFIGVALAEIFYFAIRAGFFGTDTPTQFINPYGIAAVAGLVGLFSKQATDKLREVFETLFQTAEGYGDETRDDSLATPAPVLASVEPVRLEAGSSELELTLRGEGFVRDSVARVSLPTGWKRTACAGHDLCELGPAPGHARLRRRCRGRVGQHHRVQPRARRRHLGSCALRRRLTSQVTGGGSEPTLMNDARQGSDPAAGPGAGPGPGFGLPRADTGNVVLDWINGLLLFFIHVERRFDPFFRPGFDWLFRDRLSTLVTALINRKRQDDGLGLAEERAQPDEEAHLDEIITAFRRR